MGLNARVTVNLKKPIVPKGMEVELELERTPNDASGEYSAKRLVMRTLGKVLRKVVRDAGK